MVLEPDRPVLGRGLVTRPGLEERELDGQGEVRRTSKKAGARIYWGSKSPSQGINVTFSADEGLDWRVGDSLPYGYDWGLKFPERSQAGMGVAR